MNLQEAREQWDHTIRAGGGRCPCCDRWGKIYPRSINTTMIRSLRWIDEQHMLLRNNDWIDVPNTAPRWLVRSNQLPTLRWWGLVERPADVPPEEADRVKHLGLWRLTERGRKFLRGLTTVPKTVITYAGTPVGWSDEHVSVEQCNSQFMYAEVMQ